MNKAYLILITILFALLSVFSTVKYYFCSTSEKESTLVENFIEREKIQYSNNGSFINLTTNLYEISNKQKNAYSIDEIITDEYTLVFYFTEINCQVCVKQVFKIIQELNIQKVLFISRFSSARNLLVFKNVNDFQGNFYMIESTTELNGAMDSNNLPYLFILDSSGKIHDLFVPDKSIPNLTKSYLQITMTKYFS